MARSADDRRARRAAVVNGALVFGIPAAVMLLGLGAGSQQPRSDRIVASGVSTERIVGEQVQFGLVFVAWGAVAVWRTLIHARRYQAGESRGWQGVAEAALCGFAMALFYLAQGIVTRPREAPPYIIVYGTAAAVLGAIVGLVLRTIAVMVLKLSKSAPA